MRIDAKTDKTQMANPQAKARQQVYANSMRQHMQSAMDSNVDKGMMPNGAPQMPQDPNSAEFFNPQMRPMPGQQAPPSANSNHALQDYQMQLMLLEQQNKKRLLMARQEQDNMTNGPNGPVPASGQPQNFAPAMSPSNSRAGPSPGPNEQMRRGTPKMAPGVVPSPTADGGMPGRASPAPGQFDPNNPMNPAMFPMGMMKGPNGQMMQPPSSHPAFAQMNQQQQMDMYRQAQARNGQAQMANGFMPQPGPMMGGQPPPQPPNMTPQQRNAAMPPPPAPGNDGPRTGTGPSSPSQNQAPPTPSQANKPNTKSKKDSKGANKVTNHKCFRSSSFLTLILVSRVARREQLVLLLKSRLSSLRLRLQHHRLHPSPHQLSPRSRVNLRTNSNHRMRSPACLASRAAICPTSELLSATWMTT
jgi:hypothetical protein